MPRLPLFVFGSLRRSESNHLCLAGSYDRCLEATLRDFRRVLAGHGFPTILRLPGAQVVGELFFISPRLYDATLRRCDDLEELEPGQLAGRFYRRMQVNVETVEGSFAAWVYADASMV
ncbi:MAG: gamma-glutamylcyclotransferase [Planctomycetaceae bacterium]|nr:gamma-glutamylcyclotransferase [Planctomycetaceae bacterium]